MHISSLLLCVLFSTVGLTDDWTPPEKPDPAVIHREAKADTARGKYETALAKHLWYHENATKLQPSQSGVRLSFALNNWLVLGEAYPPALEKMRQIRDETEKKIRDENRVRVRFSDFHDFVALNKTLRNEKRTAEAFLWLHETDPDDAKRVFAVARPALIKQKAYDVCGLYAEPKEDITRIGEHYQSGLTMSKRVGKHHREYVEKKLVNEAATLVAILVKNERFAEAEETANEVKAFVKARETLKELEHALEAALAGKVPRPWP